MIVLGVHGCPDSGSHDASAALVVDGQLIAASEEERFSRRKHSKNEAPVQAIQQCLAAAGIGLGDVDAVAAGWNMANKLVSKVPRRSRQGWHWANLVFPEEVFPVDEIPTAYFIKHHLSHISSGFFLSGFGSAVCVCIDGQGEEESSTIAVARGGSVQLLSAYGRGTSLGLLYEEAANYTGLGYDVPGKLMGLAAYGRPSVPIPLSFDADRGEFTEHLPALGPDVGSADAVCAAYRDHFVGNVFPFRLGQEGELWHYIDFAASVQHKLNETACLLSRYAQRITGEVRLVLTGGVALNCSMNTDIEQAGLFEEVFVPPGANDASTSIGAAMEVCRLNGLYDTTVPRQLGSAQLGSEFSAAHTKSALARRGLGGDELSFHKLIDSVAHDLGDNRVVAWFNGRAEFGPRALGGRSLLASACDRSNHRRINEIKGRELWRPLSPSILRRFYSEVFEARESALDRYMLKAVPVRQRWRSRVPAVVHVDGTSRPQAVGEDSNPTFHALLGRYRELTGVPLVLNTSLNSRGEPIVNSPEDAIEFFLRKRGVDVLVIDSIYVARPAASRIGME